MLPSVTFEIHVLHHIFSKGRGSISRCVLLSKWCKGHSSTIHKWVWICLNPSLATHTPNKQIQRGWGLELESTLEFSWIVSLTAKDFCKQLQLLSFHPLNIHRDVFDLYVLQRGAVHGESLCVGTSTCSQIWAKLLNFMTWIAEQSHYLLNITYTYVYHTKYKTMLPPSN